MPSQQELIATIRAALNQLEELHAAALVTGDYREDGFSHETSYGCRRFIDVDEVIARWRAVGDPDHIEAADILGSWWGFSPAYFPALQPDSLGDRLIVTAAYKRSWSLAILGAEVAEFSTRIDGTVFRHNIALVNSGDPAEWVRKWLDERRDLPSRVKAIRERHEELGTGRPRPSPLPPGWASA